MIRHACYQLHCFLFVKAIMRNKVVMALTQEQKEEGMDGWIRYECLSGKRDQGR